jgi:hypothetical protein
MTCLVCGSENRPGNRFCGLCGVDLTARRTPEGNASRPAETSCASCGSTNEPAYKFCGLCGTKIEPQPPGRQRQSTAERGGTTVGEDLRSSGPIARGPHGDSPKASQAHLMPSEATRVLDRNQVPATPSMSGSERRSFSATVGGPSFLGLSSEPQNCEYLLEDENPSPGRFRGLLLVLLLAAIAGLIFTQWRSNHNATTNAHELAKPSSSGVAASQAENRTLSTPQDAPSSTTGPASNTEAEQQHDQPDAKDDVNKAASTPESSADTSAKEPDQKENQSIGKSAGVKTTSKANETEEEHPERSKYPSTTLIKAQQYLQGRGVRQNCEQGLLYLKAATKQNDPDAAVQMAALYASGHCLRQDRVEAYRWFRSASDLQPPNRWIEKNLNLLWAEMTPAERQRISK